jgi:hypothetical protein
MLTVSNQLKRKNVYFDNNYFQAQKRYISEKMASEIGILKINDNHHSYSENCFESFNPFLQTGNQTQEYVNAVTQTYPYNQESEVKETEEKVIEDLLNNNQSVSRLNGQLNSHFSAIREPDPWMDMNITNSSRALILYQPIEKILLRKETPNCKHIDSEKMEECEFEEEINIVGNVQVEESMTMN